VTADVVSPLMFTSLACTAVLGLSN